MHRRDLTLRSDSQQHLRVPVELFGYIARFVRDAHDLSRLCALCQALQVEVQRVMYKDILVYDWDDRTLAWYHHTPNTAITETMVTERFTFLKSISGYIHSVAVVGNYGDDLKEWLNMMPNLESLALWPFYAFEHGEARIGSNIHRLRHFSTNLTVQGDGTLSRILSSNPNLESLSFAFRCLDLPIAVPKEHLENITSLSFRRVNVALFDPGLRAVLTLATLAPNIKSLNLDGCFDAPYDTPQALLSTLNEFLPRLPGLVNISGLCFVLAPVQTSIEILATVSAHLPALKYFGVLNITATSSRDCLVAITPRIILALEKLQCLETVAVNLLSNEAGLRRLDLVLENLRLTCKSLMRVVVIVRDDEVLGEWTWYNSRWHFVRYGKITPYELWELEVNKRHYTE